MKISSFKPLSSLHLLQGKTILQLSHIYLVNFIEVRLDFLFPFFVNWEEKIPEIILYSSISRFSKHANVRQAHYSCQYLCRGSIDFFPIHIYMYCSCKVNICTSLSLADQRSLPKQISPYQMETFNGKVHFIDC